MALVANETASKGASEMGLARGEPIAYPQFSYSVLPFLASLAQKQQSHTITAKTCGNIGFSHLTLPTTTTPATYSLSLPLPPLHAHFRVCVPGEEGEASSKIFMPTGGKIPLKRSGQ